MTIFEFGLSGAGMYLTRPHDVFELFAGARMAISLLDDHLAGRPPLTAEAFAEQYRTGANYYFVGHPVSGTARADQ